MDRETSEKRKREELENLRNRFLHPHKKLTEEEGRRLRELEKELDTRIIENLNHI